MKLRFVLTGMLVALLAVSANAQETKKPEMDPAAMQAMIAAGTPGDPHKKLDAFAGTWDTKITMWMAPGADPLTSTGTSTNTWVMGGRYLEQRFKGDFGGMPFEGLGYTGYDNVKKEYWGSWIDNMSTAVMVSRGSLDSSGKVWNFDATFPDPVTGKDQDVKEKITVVDANHHTMEMWMPGPDGKAFKSMEIAYSRRK